LNNDVIEYFRCLSVSIRAPESFKEVIVESPSITHYTSTEVAQLDPYAFLALLGKRVIHPGGRRSSEELFRLAGFQLDQ